MSELDDYDYTLPGELIAQQPLSQRTDARLMLVDRRRQTIDHAHIRDLPDLLSAEDALVLNNTRVLPARLVGRRAATGGRWSGLFLESDAQGNWRLLGKTRGKLAPGEFVELEDADARCGLRLRMVTPLEGGMWVARPQDDSPTLELLERVGRVPLPPYIRGGEMEAGDVQSYQTVFASEAGAVAAPTAGLHFTQALLDKIRGRGVSLFEVTLHVGVGTFRPIATERLADHQMHSEWCRLDEATAGELAARRAAQRPVIAVGTTSMRVLEAASAEGTIEPYCDDTNLFIRPGFEFHACDGLLTNFHLPKSSLLVLVRTFGGEALIRRAYQLAIEERYRFYSYGDAMLIR